MKERPKNKIKIYTNNVSYHTALITSLKPNILLHPKVIQTRTTTTTVNVIIFFFQKPVSIRFLVYQFWYSSCVNKRLEIHHTHAQTKF